MPEISDSEFRMFAEYQTLGTPNEVRKKVNDLEKDNRDQREEINTLKSKQLKENEVALPKAEAERLEQYKALGKPDEVKQKVEAGNQAQDRLQGYERKEAARPFVKAAGLADETVDTLVAIPALAQAAFEVRDEKVDGKDQKVAYLVFAGADGKQEALSFTKAVEKYPLLNGLKRAEKSASSTTFVRQDGETRGTQGSTLFDSIRENAKKAKDNTKVQEEARTSRPLEDRLGMTRTQ